ncbi:MAG: MalY/PatB family protein [Halanaerobiales bacterium]
MINRFDKIIDRKNTNSVKWDSCKRVFGSDDVLPMWVADSDWTAPQVVLNALEERINHGIFGYTEPGDELNQVVVDWVKKRYGWETSPEWLVYISGVVPAVNVAVKSFAQSKSAAEQRSGVIVQPPVYYPFFSAVKNNGAKVIENQLIYKGDQYNIDFNDLEKKLAVADLIILCSPHNPTGRVWNLEELERIGELCLKYDVRIVSDEIHSDLVYSGHKHIPIASLSNDLARNTITMIAPSKAFNLAGLHAAVTIIPDAGLKRSFVKTMDGFVTAGNIMGYTAMRAAYSKGEEWLEEQMKYLGENRDYTMEYVDEYIPGIEAIKPEGTYLIWLDCRGLGLDNKELEDFMVKVAKVGLDVGTWFGSGGEGFMRLNLACPRSILEEGLKRIRKAVENLEV